MKWIVHKTRLPTLDLQRRTKRDLLDPLFARQANITGDIIFDE